jgi:arylsulfatase A-like enzyme
MPSRLLLLLLLTFPSVLFAAKQPNVILVMADDMGWGQTGYYGHPALKTPHLDAMAKNGLRFDRFYAGAPNCSPTRATVLTGRSNDRTGVLNHGYALNLQEKTIGSAFKKAGYATGHFGKWHLNGVTGPGAPIFKNDDHSPSAFGLDTWLSVTNFFDLNPILSRNGKFEEHKGDSSEIVVEQALEFIRRSADTEKPFFTIIWYGTPHSPWMASQADQRPFDSLDDRSKKHYGELVAMDRSIGTLRAGLRELDIADNTILWFNGDNGGLSGIKPTTVSHLRGYKNSVYEGGLRVPAILEWPAKITPRVSVFPSCTMDIFPTLIELASLNPSSISELVDGLSLKGPLLDDNQDLREEPIGFRHTNRGAMIYNNLKLVTQQVGSGKYEIYDLRKDPSETTNIIASKAAAHMDIIRRFESWTASVDSSAKGADYPEGRVIPLGRKQQISWLSLPQYQAYFPQWKTRPEFKPYIDRYQQKK